MTKTFHRSRFAIAGVLALALQGCGTSQVSRDISDAGVAREVVFPRIDQDAWLKEGTFPNLDNLRAAAPGMTKDQLYASFGRPHFREGLAGVREWDYVFNFRTGAGTAFVTCQYKVIFDSEGKAGSFHWLPASCADQLRKPAAAPLPAPVAAPAPVPPAPATRKFTLAADGLFRFGGGRLEDLLPAGQRAIEQLAKDLQVPGRRIVRVQVTGHTDRLGSIASNDALSLARADTVRELLVRHGVARNRVQTAAVGPRAPVVDCAAALRRAALAACLAPNRRVDIEVAAEQP